MNAEEIVKMLAESKNLSGVYKAQALARIYMKRVAASDPAINDEAFNAEVLKYYKGKRNFDNFTYSGPISAIKYVRHVLGLGLKEAKDYVDRLVAQS